MRVQVSGSTATVLVVAGWHAVVANVGDSCAYLDTGVEVVLVRALPSRLMRPPWRHAVKHLCASFTAMSCLRMALRWADGIALHDLYPGASLGVSLQ
jgi:hypothetical protein